MALEALYVAIKRRRVNFIVELDRKSLFDNIPEERLVQLVEKRIAGPRVLRLIQQWLAAGVLEDGVWPETEAGTPQGAAVSPLLSNECLHDARGSTGPNTERESRRRSSSWASSTFAG